MKSLCLLFIWAYQHTFSFDHGPFRFFFPNGYCRFFPSCSEYARLAILRFGCWKGSRLALKRLLRCHPFHPGGVDFPPTS